MSSMSLIVGLLKILMNTIYVVVNPFENERWLFRMLGYLRYVNGHFL